MARENEAVFHSFMPTNNRVNIPLKINGDFSTDPSRTKIVLDTETTDTINNVVELFGKIIEPIWQKKNGYIWYHKHFRTGIIRSIKNYKRQYNK